MYSNFRLVVSLLIFVFCIILFGATSYCQVSKIDVSQHAKGTLPVANGGTGSTSAGTNGQVLICDGVSTCAPGDPIVSYNYVTLLNASSATAQQISSFVRIPTFSTYGTLSVVGAGILGSPAGCTLTYSVQNNLGGQNSGVQQTISFTPANSYQSFDTQPQAALGTADQISATYNCATFPTAGTVSVVFTPAITVNSITSDVSAAVSISSTTCPGTGCTQLTMEGRKSASLSFPSATWTGTVTFESTIDGTNWVGVDVFDELNEKWITSFACAGTCSGMWWYESNGAIKAVRARATAWTSGTATGTLLATVQETTQVEWEAGIGSPIPPNAILQGGKDANGNLQAYVIDPCSAQNRSSALINATASATIITGTAAKQTYICSLNLITATAQNIALTEGTGTTCTTGIGAMAGGLTAGSGWNFGANGGLVIGVGSNWVFKTATLADNVCLQISGTGQVSGNMTYVQF